MSSDSFWLVSEYLERLEGGKVGRLEGSIVGVKVGREVRIGLCSSVWGVRASGSQQVPVNGGVKGVVNYSVCPVEGGVEVGRAAWREVRGAGSPASTWKGCKVGMLGSVYLEVGRLEGRREVWNVGRGQRGGLDDVSVESWSGRGKGGVKGGVDDGRKGGVEGGVAEGWNGQRPADGRQMAVGRETGTDAAPPSAPLNLQLALP